MALLGRNGAGKSTTLKAIAGIAPPARGAVRVLGKPMQGKKPHVIARNGIGFVPEDRQVFPEHTVEDNLIIAAKKGRTAGLLERAARLRNVSVAGAVEGSHGWELVGRGAADAHHRAHVDGQSDRLAAR